MSTYFSKWVHGSQNKWFTQKLATAIYSQRSLSLGKYKYTPTEKYLDVSLDVNGQKKFIAQIGLRRRDVNNGYVYQPKLYVAVNGERIVELSGAVRVVEKNEINHCSIDLEFKTKKVSMELSGYVRRGVTSFSSNLTLSYQFSTKEYVVLATKLINKSSQNLIHFLGDLSVRTTAYKHLNFESSLNFQVRHGRMQRTFYETDVLRK